MASAYIAEVDSINKVVQFFTDPANHIELSDAENQAIVDVSGKMCDWATELYAWIVEMNNAIRPIAIAHSYPNKK